MGSKPEASPFRKRDARGRRVWPWPVAVGVLAAVARTLGVSAPIDGLALASVAGHAAAAVAIWVFARAVSVHYGTALAAGVLYAIHPAAAGLVPRTAPPVDPLDGFVVAAVSLAGVALARDAVGATHARAAFVVAIAVAAALRPSAVVAPVALLAVLRDEPADGRTPLAGRLGVVAAGVASGTAAAVGRALFWPHAAGSDGPAGIGEALGSASRMVSASIGVPLEGPVVFVLAAVVAVVALPRATAPVRTGLVAAVLAAIATAVADPSPGPALVVWGVVLVAGHGAASLLARRRSDG